MAAGLSQIPRISVVVPSYNQGRFLNEALASIFRQEYPHLEVVVMDGGSTDDSVAIIKSHAHRLKYWQSQKDGGQSAAINAGIRHCSGDLVAWLNSDDFYWENALWSVGQAYAQYPGHGLYIGNGLRYDQTLGSYIPFCSRHVALNRSALIHGTDFLLQPSVFFLRSAWEKVEGLDLNLNFCMDWDIFIRIAQRYPAVILQEFLGVSREYEETKTRNGKMKRAAEIVRMVQSHTRTEVTSGSLLYLFETLLQVTKEGMPEDLRHHLRDAQNAVAGQISAQHGGHGFPERNDPQDKVYLPYAMPGTIQPPFPADSYSLPSISIITPSLNRLAYLQTTLESIQNQQYGPLETHVVDGGSTDGSVEFLAGYQERLKSWSSESDHGPAQAINKGIARAQGEVLAWLNPGDLLAAGALREVGRAFAADPELDLVFGNAVSIDAQGRFFLADQGSHLSGLWLGAFKKTASWPAYGTDVYAIPQATVFFRRRLLNRLGTLDESFRYIHAYELFSRFARETKIKKIGRIQALLRVRPCNPDRWNEMLIELYRLSRPQWPSLLSKQFPGALLEFLQGYVGRKFGGQGSRLASGGGAALVALSAVTRLGNPERWWKHKFSVPSQEAPPLRLPPLHCGVKRPLFVSTRKEGVFHVLFCAPRLEARELQILSYLGEFSTIELFEQSFRPPDQAAGAWENLVDAVHTPMSIATARRDMLQGRRLRSRFAGWLRRLGLAVPGSRYPLQVMRQLPIIHVFFRKAIQETLERNSPDFLFVSPQANPLALTLATEAVDTRLILLDHEVEREPMRLGTTSQRGILKMARYGEARRARTFEKDNLALYDGVVVVSEGERQRLVEDHAYPAERIRVLGVGCDPNFHAWLAQVKNWPRRRVDKTADRDELALPRETQQLTLIYLNQAVMVPPLEVLGMDIPRPKRNRMEARSQAMAYKFIVGASLLLGAFLSLCGCQNTPPRTAQAPGFTQKQGSTNPPVVPANNPSQPPLLGANTQTLQPNGSFPPTYANNPPSGFGGAPSASPAIVGSQARTTQPFIPTNGAGPGFGATNGASPSFVNNPPPPPTNPGGGPTIP